MTDDGRFKKGEHRSPFTEFKKGRHWRTPQPYWEKKWLQDNYVIKGLSSDELAKQFNCKKNNILYFLKKHGIKARSISEARELKYWGARGLDNPMYNRKGELNPRWQGGITPERQAFYTSNEWKNASRFVWKRDNFSCQRCKIGTKDGIPFHIHHIVPFRNKELRVDVQNLILLCEVCHHWVHSKKNTTSLFISAGGDVQ